MTVPLKDHQIETWYYNRAIVFILKTFFELMPEEDKHALSSLLLQRSVTGDVDDPYLLGATTKGGLHLDRAMRDMGLLPQLPKTSWPRSDT